MSESCRSYHGSLVAQFGKELLLVKEAVLIDIRLLNELEDIVVADIDVQVLVEDCLDFIQTHQSSFLSVEQCKHVQSLLLASSSEEPLLSDKFDDFTQRERVLVLMGSRYLVFDLFAIHFSIGEVAEDASEILPVDEAGVA